MGVVDVGHINQEFTMSIYRNYIRWVTAAVEADREGREVYDIKDRQVCRWAWA